VAAIAVIASVIAVAPTAGAAELAPAAAAGTLSGTVSYLPESAGTTVLVSSGRVQFYSFVTGDLAYEVNLEPDGSFAINGVEAGPYRLAIVSNMGAPYTPVREWYPAKATYGEADTIVFNAGQDFNFGEIVINPRDISLERDAGTDRFATAAAVAQRGARDGSGGTIFVVNGLTFPDALSAGAATTTSVLLTVQRDTIPAPIAAQLTRIQPSRIVIVGGTGAVSTAVETELRSYLADPLSPTGVVRIAGSNRYETSRAVVSSFYGFNSAPTHIFLATGRNFPDALSAVPAAISIGAAVLLVDGSASSLDTETATMLGAIGAPVTIIGGTGSVSAAIETQVRGIVGDGSTTRIAGADRYATSVEVARNYFGIADYAFIANGLGFADALAAGPVAGAFASPVYLVRQSCTPSAVSADINAVRANVIVAVGGTGVVSNNALVGTAC
jgi:putative cell wall-binding protein